MRLVPELSDDDGHVVLGAPINSDAIEGALTVSEDGRMLFLFSSRPGGFAGGDI